MINLGSIQLPVSAATKSFALLAKRGAGKSYAAGVMEEEFFANDIPFVVFDPIDVHWGLRLQADGIKKGLPVVVFGLLSNADIPLTDTMGKQIAKAVIESNISCVISTFGMSKSGQRRLIADFAEELLIRNNVPRHIFIEEAHEFVPQRVVGEMSRCFAAVEALVVMGRNRGLGVTLINQRAATINKDVLTQIDTLLAFRSVGPQDRKALQEWVEAHGTQENFDEFMKTLPSLETGKGWIWSPEFMNVFERISIRKRGTFHPDREKLGDKFVMPKLEAKDIQVFIDNFKVTKGMVYKDEKSKIISDSTIKPLKKISNNDIDSVSYPKNIFLEKKDALKDKEIEELKDKIKELEGWIKAIGKIVEKVTLIEETVTTEKEVILPRSFKLNMWLEKLPGGASKILKILADTYPMKYTRSQLALSTGIKINTLTTNTNYLLTLKRNNMIIEENHLISINPDLL